MAKLLFDEEYTGPRCTYGLRLRPLASVHVPPGWIIGSDRPNDRYPHGTVDYPAPLSPEVAAAYELERVEADAPAA